MKYTAIMNTPGYMPWSDDEPPMFDTPGEAWQYLAGERREQEDQEPSMGHCEDCAEYEYSETVQELDACAAANKDADVIYGITPGHGDHDLGIAYSVLEVDDNGEVMP